MEKQILNYLNEHKFEAFSKEVLFWQAIESQPVEINADDVLPLLAVMQKPKDKTKWQAFKLALTDLETTHLVAKKRGDYGEEAFYITLCGRCFIDPNGGLLAEIKAKEHEIIKRHLLEIVDSLNIPQSRKLLYKEKLQEMSFDLIKELLVKYFPQLLEEVVDSSSRIFL